MSESNISMPIGCQSPAADMSARSARSGAWRLLARELLKWPFSFPAMLGTFIVGAAFYCGRAFVVDPDLWWHIKTGQLVLATHQWPVTDPYSFTAAGQPWIAFEWLGDTLLAAVSRVGGVRGLDLLLISLGSAVLLALYLLGTIRSGNSKAGFLATLLLCPLAFPSFTLRPQMLGYIFLIFALIALELFRQGQKRAVWVLPPLLLVWVNTHGSWTIGLGAIFVYWVCGLLEFRIGGIEAKRWNPKQRQQISFVFLLSLIAVTITPYGTRLIAFPLELAASYPVSVANVLEWMPMPFNMLGGKIFLAMVLGFFVFQMAFHFAWRLEELLLFLGGVVMACLHVRFILLFVPFFAPLLATMLAPWLPAYSRGKDKYVLNAILMAGLVAAMVHYFPSEAALNKKIADKFPVKAVAYLRAHPVPGPMLDSYGFGGYLVWSGFKVFIDGRSELYERTGVFSDYLQLTHLKPGGLSVLRRYQVQSCLLTRDEPLAIVLAALPDWREVYSDRTSALFVRRDTASMSTAPRPGEPAAKRGG
jgi:hypothetical protein